MDWVHDFLKRNFDRLTSHEGLYEETFRGPMTGPLHSMDRGYSLNAMRRTVGLPAAMHDFQ